MGAMAVAAGGADWMGMGEVEGVGEGGGSWEVMD